MTAMTAKYIFLFLLLTAVTNFIISLTAHLKTKNKEFRILSFYWAAIIFTFVVAGMLSQTENQIAFAFFFQILPINALGYLMSSILGIEFKWKKILLAQFVLMSLSTYLLLETNLGFSFSLIPVCICLSIPYIPVIIHTLVTHTKESNWLDQGMGLVFIAAVIHHFNYAFFRLDPTAAAWGWAISLAEFQCISVFLPLMINHQNEMRERNNLQLAIKKISGEASESHSGINDLYRELEFQILQKEEIRQLLQLSNASLEEEREINEVLIKTISHDLANPLTAIGAYAELLKQNRIPQDQTELAWNRLSMNTNSALDMITRIRTAILTKSQAKLVEIHDVSLNRSIKKLSTLFEAQLEGKNLKLIYNHNGIKDDLVSAEENALVEHVFANVLSNAIKFSYEGSEIQINLINHSETIQVQFKDFGTGINETRLGRRLLHSTEGTKGESGTGFGMMVMGYFLRKFGGTMDITSSVKDDDKGTTVSIFLLKADHKQTTLHSIPN